MEQIRKFDDMTRVKEERMNLHGDWKRLTKSTRESTPRAITGRKVKIEDYYIKSIEAKLELLDELGGLGSGRKTPG
jgi:hypothetical protein